MAAAPLTPLQQRTSLQLYLTPQRLGVISQPTNSVPLSLLTVIQVPPHGIAPVALFPPPGHVGWAAGPPRNNPMDDSPGELRILLNSQYKIPRAIENQLAHDAMTQFLAEVSEFHPGVPNIDLFNRGIGYWNCVANCRHHYQIAATTLFDHKVTEETHRSIKNGLAALVLHAVAYGWNTKISWYHNLIHWRDSETVSAKRRHYCMVLPLVQFFKRCMDPQGDLDIQEILSFGIKQMINNLRTKMRLYGVWSHHSLLNQLPLGKGPNIDAGVHWVGGVRCEFARLLMHLAPIHPRGGAFCHPDRGLCTQHERDLVINRTNFDTPNDIVVVRGPTGR
jgi:hypothetical protein